MLTETPRSLATRFVALDVHRQYLMVGAVDREQQVVLSPRLLALRRLPSGRKSI